MAFANLFTRLSAVEEAVRSPGQHAFTHRNETERGERGCAGKRRTQGEQAGPHQKKQCHKVQTTRTSHASSVDSNHHRHNTSSEHASVGFNRDSSSSDHAGYNNRFQHQRTDRGRPAFRGGSRQSRRTSRQRGGNRRGRNDNQDFRVERPRFMTQEFKDQNTLSDDGRLLCRHFLWGRCIKGDDCQLEHVQGYNDLVKEVCKFYIQGFCTKGASCPFMHKSFPCKFYHRKGKCSQGADCRFSHESLNDVTNKLLDEALKREIDLSELAKKAEQDSSGQPANTDESEIIEANKTPDVFKQPLRPNFYKSADTNAESEAASHQTEQMAGNMEEAVPPHASDAAQPHSSLSTNLNDEEPVCYSVEAVLGPQLSKPFTSFFTTPKSQESAPVSSSDCTSDSANQSQVPYSVDAVLRSCKLMKNPTFGHTLTTPTAQTISDTPKTYFEEITDPLQSSETQNKRVLYSVNTRNEAHKSKENIFRSLSSFQVRTDGISKTYPSCNNPASGDDEKQGGNMPESLKPAESGSHEIKLLSTDITCSINSKNEGVPSFRPTQHKWIFPKPPSQTSTSTHPIQVKPHLSVLTSISQTSFKPFCPSPGFREFKSKPSSPSEPGTSSFQSRYSGNSHIAAKQPTETQLRSKEMQFGLKLGTKPNYSTETTAECSSKMEHCGDLAVGCKKTLKRPCCSLSANPIADTPLPIDSVTSSSCSQGSISFCAAPQSADCRSNHLKTALEPDKASARSFLSLFVAPLSADPLPCTLSRPDHTRTPSCSQQSMQSVDNTSHTADSKQRASNVETSQPHQVGTNVKEIPHTPRFPNFSPNARIGKDSSLEHINPPAKLPVNPVSSLVSDPLSEMSTSPTPRCNSPSTTHAHQQLPDISSNKRSAAAATANSRLQTLFACLRPYQQDGQQQNTVQISAPAESENKDESSTECVFVKQQRKKKNGSRHKKELETQDSHKPTTEKTVAHSAEHQPSLQTPQILLEGREGSTLGRLEMTESQMRNSGTHNLPFKPVALLKHRHTRPGPKHTSEEGRLVDGNAAAASLKDLFKTLDTVSH
ncbi:uncharacterized protein LOC118326826 [Morone saxatilis]|uniref:uncharacterized protein LOC118326826 n=1 Tax=Morone saxatilis TaxID=34816 RepID=UPI0015E1F1C4|nr:uncharacterized protein LOC118326826 [Morone saxatilis]